MSLRLALLLLIALPLRANDAVESVRQAEIGFAKAFADRDQARFFSYVADDATFMGGGNTLRGKKAVMEQWSRFFGAPQAPFAWGPERVVVNAEGTLGFSTGPVVDPGGRHVSNFISTWEKQPDGTWKILFDIGAAGACLADNVARVEEGFVTTDGVKLYYRKVGNRPQTLIVPLDHILHDDFARLADVATVITYDMRNRGRSSAVENVNMLTIQHDARDLEAVREHFNLDRFVPVGFSYLGAMVGLYATEHPDRVRRMIQLSPGPMRQRVHRPHGPEDMGGPADARAQLERARASNMTPKEYCELEFNVFMRYLLVGNPANATRLKHGCALPNEWPSHLASHWPALMSSFETLSFTPESLAKVTAPVLVIHGTRDRQTAYAAGREWAASWPSARLVTIEGAAHATWVEDPVNVLGAIREFLRGDWPMGSR